MRLAFATIIAATVLVQGAGAQEGKEPDVVREWSLDDLTMAPEDIVEAIVRCRQMAESWLRADCMARMYIGSSIPGVPVIPVEDHPQGIENSERLSAEQILEISGSGTTNTRPFTVDRPFIIAWQSLGGSPSDTMFISVVDAATNQPLLSGYADGYGGETFINERVDFI